MELREGNLGREWATWETEWSKTREPLHGFRNRKDLMRLRRKEENIMLMHVDLTRGIVKQKGSLLCEVTFLSNVVKLDISITC